MTRYFFKRILAIGPTLLGISLVCFVLVQFTPGGPVEQTIAQWRGMGGGESTGSRGGAVTEEQRKMLTEYYGFDRPILERYAKWMGKVMRLDLGESYYYSKPVSAIIREAIPVSLFLGGASFFLTYLICIPLGICKAVKKNTIFDGATSVLVFLFYSIPSFALGILLIVLFGGGSFWNVFPIAGLTSDGFGELSLFGKIKDLLAHLVLPLLCYTIGSFASVTLLMKNALLEEMQQDYVTAARAKGLSEKKVVLRHALRNALLPIASGLGQWIAVFFTGSLLIETVFSLRGLGRLSYDSILHRDYPVVLAIILLLSVCHVVGNLLSDFLYVLLDKRIDYT